MNYWTQYYLAANLQTYLWGKKLFENNNPNIFDTVNSECLLFAVVL